MKMNEIRCSDRVSRRIETRTGPGRIVGRILTYGERASDRAELFERGALSWPDDGVILNRQHARGAPIMRVLPTLVGDELRIDQLYPGYRSGPGRGDGDPLGADARFERQFSGGAAVIPGRRAAHPVRDDDGGRAGRRSEL